MHVLSGDQEQSEHALEVSHGTDLNRMTQIFTFFAIWRPVRVAEVMLYLLVPPTKAAACLRRRTASETTCGLTIHSV